MLSKIRVPNFRLILRDEDKKFILEKTREVLESHRWTVGPMGVAFEKAFCRFTGAPHAVTVANGGVALMAIFQGLDIPKASIVVSPTLTAPPTPHAILASGMRILFVDSDPSDLGIDLEDLKQKIKRYGEQVRAVVAVHVGGWISSKIKEIARFCAERGLALIEDCAHAHGSFLNGDHAGSTAVAAAYSFFMTKSLTCGEGGMVTAKDPKLIEKVKIIRNYGKDQKGIHIMKGSNFKLSEFDAAVGLWAATNASYIIGERRKVAARYDRMLEGIGGIRVVKVPKCESGYYKYIVVMDEGLDRDAIKRRLLVEHGVELAGGVYDTLCHEEPYFRTLPQEVLNAVDCFPKAENFSRRQLCLPLYPGLSPADQEIVVGGLKQVLSSALR